MENRNECAGFRSPGADAQPAAPVRLETLGRRGVEMAWEFSRLAL